jgi:hypothetical protein
LRSVGSNLAVFALCVGDIDADGDVDGSDLSRLVLTLDLMGLDEFATDFGKPKCP